jgi:microcystin-dependent protein
MSEPFIGQVSIFSFAFAPTGWAQCNGQLLPINQYQALFSLLGTQYGGNGQNNFALPDLRSRLPMHLGSGYVQGQQGGTESVALTVSEIPTHTHQAKCNTAPTALSPAGNYWAADTVGDKPFAASSNSQLAAAAVGNQGQSQAHDNMGPSLVLNFCISLLGIFPSRN